MKTIKVTATVNVRTRTCDACGEDAAETPTLLSLGSLGNEASQSTLPYGWAVLTVDRADVQQKYTLCPDCQRGANVSIL